MTMVAKVLDTRGLRCPQPVLEVALRILDMKKGDVLEVLGDCPSLEKDLRTWCKRVGRVLLCVQDEGENRKRVRIRF